MHLLVWVEHVIAQYWVVRLPNKICSVTTEPNNNQTRDIKITFNLLNFDKNDLMLLHKALLIDSLLNQARFSNYKYKPYFYDISFSDLQDEKDISIWHLN